MGQNMGSGGAFVGSGWSLQSDQALQPLEPEFDPPSQTIEGKNIRGCEVFRLERSDHDHPIRGIERLFRYLVASPLCVPACPASRGGSSLRRLLDCDQTQRERVTAFAFYPDRPIDQPAGRRPAPL